MDDIRNASLYYGLGSGIEAALRYLETADFAGMEPGRYEIGSKCYAIVQDYVTGPSEEKRWEAHRKYIDVQFVADGAELMGYADLAALRVLEDYDEAEDIAWLSGDGGFLAMRKGVFMILFPEDAHMPRVEVVESSAVRKVVVKVPVG